MIHSFDVDLATEIGVNAAIILEHFNFLIAKNAANKINHHAGRYWTCNSVSAFRRIYPYLTEYAIRTAIQRLTDEGLIMTGEFSEDKRDRTIWYALTEKGEGIFRNQQMHFSKSTNAPSNIRPDTLLNNTNRSNNNISNNIYIGGNFKKPKMLDVEAYCKERKNNVNPQAFFDYYESVGWTVGKNKPMKDWRAAVRTWERREKPSTGRTFADMYREMDDE